MDGGGGVAEEEVYNPNEFTGLNGISTVKCKSTLARLFRFVAETGDLSEHKGKEWPAGRHLQE